MYPSTEMTLAYKFYRDNRKATNHKRQDLLNACSAYLMQHTQISQESAKRTAAAILGEIESNETKTYIDIDRSTSHTIAIKQGGKTRVMTIGELVELLPAL